MSMLVSIITDHSFVNTFRMYCLWVPSYMRPQYHRTCAHSTIVHVPTVPPYICPQYHRTCILASFPGPAQLQATESWVGPGNEATPTVKPACISPSPDSVHNDGERHIPYITIFPNSTINKLYAWAKFQLPNGMIQEQLRCGCQSLPLEPQVSLSVWLPYCCNILQKHFAFTILIFFCACDLRL